MVVKRIRFNVEGTTSQSVTAQKPSLEKIIIAFDWIDLTIHSIFVCLRTV